MFSLSLTQPQIAMVLLQTGNNGRMGVTCKQCFTTGESVQIFATYSLDCYVVKTTW